MKKTTHSCPVPIEQQPIYEYETLKNSLFFSWTTGSLNHYVKNISLLLILNLSISIISVKLITTTQTSIISQVLLITLIESCLSILILLKIYLDWKYIYLRLKEATISYEESGWYDGQFWIKTPEVLLKDSIIADYIIFPILRRIKITIGILFIFFLLSLLNIH